MAVPAVLPAPTTSLLEPVSARILMALRTAIYAGNPAHVRGFAFVFLPCDVRVYTAVACSTAVTWLTLAGIGIGIRTTADDGSGVLE